MSGLDVEALLESTAASLNEAADKDRDDRSKVDSHDRHDRDRSRDKDRRRKDRSRDRRRDRDDKDEDLRSEHGSANGSHRSRRRSRSRRRDRHGDRSGGDYYRGGGRARTRSRSPDDDRYYRPSGGRSRRDDRDDDRHPRRERDRRRSRSRGHRSKTPEEELNEDERDKRTVFVQQLAARLRTKELIAFFEKVGPVKEAQIVKDRVSGRSKGLVFYLPRLYSQVHANYSLVSAMSNSRTNHPSHLPFSSPVKNF